MAAIHLPQNTVSGRDDKLFADDAPSTERCVIVLSNQSYLKKVLCQCGYMRVSYQLPKSVKTYVVFE